MIVPGGGLSPDSTNWVACKPGFFLHVRVLSRLFRRRFLDGLMALHRAGELAFFGKLEQLAEMDAFAAWPAPFRKSEWAAYSKAPFGGTEAVLAYLSRYTHRVAISNHRLVKAFRFYFETLSITFRVRPKGEAANKRFKYKSKRSSADADTVAFRWKDYRIKSGDRQKVMRLTMRPLVTFGTAIAAHFSADG